MTLKHFTKYWKFSIKFVRGERWHGRCKDIVHNNDTYFKRAIQNLIFHQIWGVWPFGVNHTPLLYYKQPQLYGHSGHCSAKTADAPRDFHLQTHIMNCFYRMFVAPLYQSSPWFNFQTVYICQQQLSVLNGKTTIVYRCILYKSDRGQTEAKRCILLSMSKKNLFTSPDQYIHCIYSLTQNSV